MKEDRREKPSLRAPIVIAAVCFGIVAGLTIWLDMPNKLWALVIGAIGGLTCGIMSKYCR
jgi:hypothetical protein